MAIIQPTVRNANEYTGDTDANVSDDILGGQAETVPDGYDGRRESYEYTLGDGDSTPLLYVRGAHLLIAVAQGAADWEIPNIDSTRVREFSIAGLATNPTNSVVGIVSCQVMPDAIRLTDTSGGSNEVTIYIYF